MMMINKNDGKPVDTTNAFVTSDPVIVLIYMLIVRVAPIGTVAALIKEISNTKNVTPYVIQEKELGEYAQKLAQSLY